METHRSSVLIDVDRDGLIAWKARHQAWLPDAQESTADASTAGKYSNPDGRQSTSSGRCKLLELRQRLRMISM